MDGPKRVPRWYFGGVSSVGAACFTHPLDLIKVHLQTQQQAKLGIKDIMVNIWKTDGILGFYSGISGGMLRQAIYSTTRFGIYEYLKKHFVGPSGDFLPTLVAGAAAGAVGGYVGTPGDVVNVRMQNDVKLPRDKRRNYKNAIHGLYRICVEEGPLKTMKGATTTTFRGLFMTIGQVACYDICKNTMLSSGYFGDNTVTHTISSAVSAFIATVLTQPIDVVKTRYMNAKPGQFKGLMHVVTYTSMLGPAGFFKGFIPAYVRLLPHNVLVFIFYEQLTKHFGVIK